MRRHRVWGTALVLFALAVWSIRAVAAEQLQVSLVNLTSPVKANSQVTLTIRTVTGAECKATVQYRERSHGLVPKTANKDGTVTWSWRLGKDVRGNFPVDVQCSQEGKQGSLSVTLVVD
jgi:hypothetical protein